MIWLYAYVGVFVVFYIVGASRIILVHKGQDEEDGLLVWALSSLVWPVTSYLLLRMQYGKWQYNRIAKKRFENAKVETIHDMLEEYRLIVQKKSKLSAAKRQEVIDFVESLNRK